MQREMKLACVLYVGLSLGGIAQGSPDVLEKTINAIRMVESSGGRDTKDGDGGRAIGEFQIHDSYWQDGTRFLKVDWPYSDARDPVKARRIVRAYLLRYQRAGKYPPTPETWAKIHNGGPMGPDKPATKAYWTKVRKHLQ